MRKWLFVIYSLVILLLWGSLAAMAGENSLVLWSHWKGEVVKNNFMNAAAEAFKQQYGIEVEIVWVPKQELMDQLATSLSAGTPDITYLDAGFTHPRIVTNLLDLSALQFAGDIASGWKLGSLPEAPNAFLPIEGLSNAMYYNKNIFQQANITVPQDRPLTWDEFLDVIRALRAHGVTPIGEGSSDRTSKIGLPVINLIFRLAGPEKTTQFINGELDPADPDVINAFTLWRQVVEAQGYDASNALSLSMNDGIFEMTDGNAGISFCGTWIYSKFGATERDKGQVGVLDWFTVDGGKGNDFYEIGWAAGYGVNKNSAHLDMAQKFIEFLMTPFAASLWIQHVQGPYPVSASAMPENSLYAALATQRAQKQGVPLFSYPGFGNNKGAFNMWEEEMRNLITGAHSAEQVVERLQSRLQRQ